MASNKNKTDKLHGYFPKVYQTKLNPNWKALLGALGENDQYLADLIEEVRKQFFVKTAYQNYLDRLGANVQVSRPRFIGMDDPTYKRYIPVKAYQPKQVKLILDSLLDVFFFKEATTAFIDGATEPYLLADGWELQYNVDNYHYEQIRFSTEDFIDITAATANEIVGVINRQARYSFAISALNNLTDTNSVRLFTNTVGAKGSLCIEGGRADIALQFEGFIANAGNGIDTEWTVTKIGDVMTFTHTGGNSPNLAALKLNDVIIITLMGNIGSFTIESIDLTNSSISFRNMLGITGVFTQSSANDIKFIRPLKSVIYTRPKRAITWETRPDHIIVEMPTSPPVVRRYLKGSAHCNGRTGLMVNRISNTVLELDNADLWPSSGYFTVIPSQTMQTHIITGFENTITTKTIDGNLIGNLERYHYTGKSGNQFTGITPALPALTSLNESSILTIDRDTDNTITVVTTSPHGLNVKEWAIIRDSIPVTVGFPSVVLTTSANGAWKITEIINNTTFKAASFGDQGHADGGFVRVERLGLSNQGSTVILLDSQSTSVTKIKGPYIWDTRAAFVLSSMTGTIAEQIQLGQSKKLLLLNTNNLPTTQGFVIFDYGTERQEGPIRYLSKPSNNTIVVDPAYIFQKDHSLGASITAISHKGPQVMGGTGDEYGPYVTDTALARLVFQDLATQVKSVGIFIEFLVRYPDQIYGILDVYNSGTTP